MGKVLVIGKGGREHAIAWRCAHEGHEVHVAPGSDGIELDAECHDVSDHEGLVSLARDLSFDVVVVGPEQPLVEGLADKLRARDVPTCGPSGKAAELEGSKAAAKRFMAEHRIPTARHVTVTDFDMAVAALEEFGEPPVVKADGLAAGKGVTVPDSWEEAEQAIAACLKGGAFSAAGATVVLEQRLRGQEASLFVLTDGKSAATFLPAQDHKRIGEGDTGPNTGGMGAYAPAPIVTEALQGRAMDRIVAPTLQGLAAEGRPFVGILFVGLMIEPSGEAKVIEYNCRFGDPEAQPLLFGLQTELYPRLVAAARGDLVDEMLPGSPAASVVLASAGYPSSSSKGDVISGIETLADTPDVKVFHAGTRRGATGWETAGGRVLGVCARGDDLATAIATAYRAADSIRFDGMQLRRDIGQRALVL